MRRNYFMRALNFFVLISLSHANWGSPGSDSNYHIQTDEGPERFFRYQTDNGQFRKEKRLQDGTVIGTNAWIDGFGYLRQNDYLADHQGYRILKSKTVFVGKDRPIEEAMKMSKKAPATSGVLVPSSVRTSYIPPASTASPINVMETTPRYSKDRRVTVLKLNEFDQSNDIQTPSVYYQPPLDDSLNERNKNEHLLPPIVVLSTTAPRAEDESHLPPIAYYPSSSSTAKPFVKDESHLPPIAYYPASSTENPLNYDNQLAVKPLNNELLPPFDGVVSITSRPRLSLNQNFYETSTRRSSIEYDRNSIESESAASYVSPTYQNHRVNNIPLYDRSKYQIRPSNYEGVGVTANGFRYYLPRQYQEEIENKRDESRDGSFGYIDPFGIRRVIYYNAGKNGFIHRKNNRYVGFNSTPYDPRP